MKRIRSILTCAASAGLSLFVLLTTGLTLCAAAWPERPVTMVVPYAAGGNTDIMARIAAQELQKTFGQSFIVENVVGAGGAIGTQKVARSAPDGYTLLFGTTAQLAIVPNLQKVAYDPINDFIPIAVFGQSFSVLAIHPSVPANNLKEFVDYAKANPRILNFGTGGVGTVSHLVSASFAARAGIEIVHVPYKGGAQATNDLLAGQIQMYFGNSVELLPYDKTDKLKLLAVGTIARVQQFPDIPTVSEFYPGFSMPAWNGVLAPHGTPRPIVEALMKRIQDIVHDPAIIDRLRTIGVDPGGPSGREFETYVRTEQVDYKSAVAAAGPM